MLHWGGGETLERMQHLRLADPAVYAVEALPADRAARRACYLRISRLHAPPGAPATAARLRAPSARLAYDEVGLLDGAGHWDRFRHITLPMISPTLFFNMVLAIIYALRVFETAFLTTVGGPNYATWFYMLHLYFAAFRDFDMGYASALAWILFVLTLAFTWVQIKWSDRWVYYEGRDREG